MSHRIALIAIVAFAAVVGVLASYDYSEAAFAAFEQKHNKRYPTLTHRLKAYQNFVLNSERAKEMQRLNPQATFGVTRFADMSPEEFRAFTSSKRTEEGFRKSLRDIPTLRLSPNDLRNCPTEVNWTKAGAMGQPDYQGDCGGGCVAFSVANNVAGVRFVSNGLKNYVAASAGETIQCAIEDGCNGGYMTDAIKWFLNNTAGRIATAQSYPYTSGNGDTGKCKLPDSELVTAVTVKSLVVLPSDEHAMAAAVAKGGPASVAVDANTFQFYTGGILTNCPKNGVDYGTVISGYNTAATTPYWSLKIAFGGDFGENGYVQIGFGSDQCGITKFPSTVLV